MIKRIGEGKLENFDDVEKEFTNIVKSINNENNTPVNSNAYNLSNVTENRTLSANEAAGTISASPTQSEVENLRDTLLSMADVLGTIINDLKTKGIIK